MFPSNGALIKTERHMLKTCKYQIKILSLVWIFNNIKKLKASKTFITTSVIKDGNTYSIHLVDPESKKKVNDEAQVEESKPSAEEQKTASAQNNKDRYTCFTAAFKDGFTLSYSAQAVEPKKGINYFDQKNSKM